MRGTAVLAGGVLVGLLLPGLAAWLRPLLPLAVFTFVTATFLRADAGLLRASLARPRLSLALPALAVIAMPLALALGLSALGLAGPLAAALVVTLACPPGTASAPFARLFGYGGELPLTLILTATIAAPLTMPAVAALVGIAIDPLALLTGLLVLMGGAGALALALRFAAGEALAANPRVLDRLVIGALLIFAVAAMDGVRAALETEPRETLVMLAAAFALSAAAMAVGGALAPEGPGARPALAMTFGNRNVGLPWAVLGGALDPTMALFFALAQIPIFVMPLLLMLGARGLRRARS